MKKGLISKQFLKLLFVGLLFFLLISVFRQFHISACTHYIYECCDAPNCRLNCYAINNLGINTQSDCDFFCQNRSKYCCDDCADHCQVDSECGSGCRCINSSSGNYCYCPTNTPTPTPTPTPVNHAPTCTISFPTDGGSSTITYDAEQYYDSNGGQVNDSATARSGRINTSDSLPA